MKESYKRDRSHNYLILETDENFQENEYSIKMITYNQIPGLLKCEIRKVNGSISLYYEITSKQCAAYIFEKRFIGYKEIKQILIGLKRALESAAGYLLDENDFLIDPEHFFIDIESEEVFLCYVPGRKGNFQKEFQDFSEYILRKLDHEEEKAVILGYEVYRQAMEESGNMDQILQLAYHEVQLREEEDKNRETVPKNHEKEKRKEETKSKTQEQKWNTQMKWKRWMLRCFVVFGMGILISAAILVSLHLGWDLTKVGGIFSILAALSAYTVSFLKNKNTEQIGREAKRKREKRQRKKGTKGVESRGEKIRISKSEQEEKKEKNNEKTGSTGKEYIGRKYIKKEEIGIGKEDIEKQYIGKAQKEKREFGKNEAKYQEIADIRRTKPKSMTIQDLDSSFCRIGENRLYQKSMMINNTDKEETELLVFDETVLLDSERIASVHRLISRQQGQVPDIYIFHTSIIVGKIRQQSDIVLDEEHISRIHARIERSGEEVYVTDLNSTNGTFVNGERLKANERRRLRSLDEVAFASIVYQYEAPNSF